MRRASRPPRSEKHARVRRLWLQHASARTALRFFTWARGAVRASVLPTISFGSSSLPPDRGRARRRRVEGYGHGVRRRRRPGRLDEQHARRHAGRTAGAPQVGVVRTVVNSCAVVPSRRLEVGTSRREWARRPLPDPVTGASDDRVPAPRLGRTRRGERPRAGSREGPRASRTWLDLTRRARARARTRPVRPRATPRARARPGRERARGRSASTCG